MSAPAHVAAPPSRRTSILPASVVLIVALTTLGLFVLVDAVTSQRTTTTTIPGIVIGGLATDPHATFFAADVVDGVPPADVASALVVPVGTRFVRRLPIGSGPVAGDYDLEDQFTIAASRAALFGYYTAHLAALRWSEYSQSPAPGGQGYELLFQRAGSDQNYWEIGIIARPAVRGVTTFEFRIFEVAGP